MKFYSLHGLIPTYLENLVNQLEFSDNKDDIEFDRQEGETRTVQVEKRIVLSTGDRITYTACETRPIEFREHHEHNLKIEGLDTIQLSAKQTSQKYEIRFATDAEYGLQRNRMLDIAKDPKVNYLFWSYPNQSHIITIDDYFEAGIKIVEFIKNQGIPADEVTLYGIEFGGHIASAVAYDFYQRQYPVRVTVYQMSSTLFSDFMSRGMEDSHDKNCKFLIHCVLIAQGGCLGFVALGFFLGNLVNTIGFFLAALTYYSGQELTHGFKSLHLGLLASGIDAVRTGLSYLIHEFFNGLGSLTTIAISAPLAIMFGLSCLHVILAIATWTLACFGYNLAKPIGEFGTNALGFATHMHIPSKKLGSRAK
ncbi:MAG: hypothetical protein CK424_01470 [Legionella sp.]|nr:MAG: hypothetical protein CK424_01470 [Legionella sp.]